MRIPHFLDGDLQVSGNRTGRVLARREVGVIPGCADAQRKLSWAWKETALWPGSKSSVKMARDHWDGTPGHQQADP